MAPLNCLKWIVQSVSLSSSKRAGKQFNIHCRMVHTTLVETSEIRRMVRTLWYCLTGRAVQCLRTVCTAQSNNWNCKEHVRAAQVNGFRLNQVLITCLNRFTVNQLTSGYLIGGSFLHQGFPWMMGTCPLYMLYMRLNFILGVKRRRKTLDTQQTCWHICTLSVDCLVLIDWKLLGSLTHQCIDGGKSR